MIVRQLLVQLASSIVVILSCSLSCIEAADASVLMRQLADLPNKNLDMSSTLNIVYPGTEQIVRYDIEELQSSWQKRSRVQYRAKQPQEKWQVEADMAESGTIIVDGGEESQEVLLLSKLDSVGRTMCKRLDRNKASRLFNLNTLDGYTKQMHLVGPSRLLSLLGENLQLVKLISSSKIAIMGPMRTIKDVLTFSFTYNQHTIVAHYSGDPAYNLPHGLPLEVVVSLGDFANKDKVFFYDFTKVRLLAEGLNLGDGSQATKQLLGKSVAAPMTDMFAIDRAVGCSRVFEPTGPAQQEANGADNNLSPLRGLARARYRFSFGARPVLQNTESKATMLKVGYEPSIRTLRVERANELHWASTTTNYLTGLTYHQVKKIASNPSMEKILPFLGGGGGDGGDDSAPKWSCVVVKATTEADKPTSTGESAAGASDNPYSLGEMLLGVKPSQAGRLRYLGLARVRGIDARMYELWGSTWPVWFQAPQVYHESRNWLGISNEAKYRSSTGGHPAQGEGEVKTTTTWNTVIYLSGIAARTPLGDSRNKHEVELTDGKLLLIEMYELDTTTLRVQQKAIFSIHDFAWHLTGASHSTGGARSEDFFSLGADACLSRDDNQYGRLDMMLTLPSDMNRMTGWLRSSSRRNFAIMQAAQEQVGLAASAIYDLESRLELDNNKQTLVPVSFRTAERVRAVNQLVYLGRGNFKPGIDKTKLAHTLAFHFQACYLLVAHRQMDTVFAYRPSDGQCYVYTDAVIGTVKLTVGTLFDMLEWAKTTGVSDRTLEVYRVRHDGTPWSADPPKSALARAETHLGALSSVDLINDISINYDNGETLAVNAKLTSFQLSELEAKISAPHVAPDRVDPVTGDRPTVKFDTNKFEGLGLVAADETSTLIESERAASDGEDEDEEKSRFAKIVQVANEMTFGQCQTRCLVDLDCGSFSWCVREGRTECILSKVNFKQSALANQLIELQSKRAAKFGQIFTLETKGLGQETTCPQVQIRKHPTCELHNKQFMQLFELSRELPPRVRYDLAEMKLYPVGHRDDCAKLCLDRTLEVLKTDVGPAKAASLGALMDLTAETSERSLKKLFQDHRDSHSKLCTAFSFYDQANYLALGDSNMNRLARRVVQNALTSGSNSSSGETGGYCLLDDLQTAAKRKQMEKEVATLATDMKRKNLDKEEDPSGRLVVALEQFVFDFRFMFDMQYGVTLRKVATLDSDIEAALTAAVMGQHAHISAREFELLAEFVKRGDNNVHWMSQVLTGGGPANCARLCFLQLVPLWPGCKSFAHMEREAIFSNQKISLCMFNTVSLRESLLHERFDLVSDVEAERVDTPEGSNASDSQLRKPRMRVWHYEPKPSFVSESLDWARAVETAASERLETDEATGGTGVGSFGAFLCSLIGISMGIFLGLKIGEQTIGLADRSRVREDTEDLVNSIHGVEMAPGENGNGGGGNRQSAGIEFSDLMAMDPATSGDQHEHDNDEIQ